MADPAGENDDIYKSVQLHTAMIPPAPRDDPRTWGAIPVENPRDWGAEELTDEQVFGPQPKPGELSDEEVFGRPSGRPDLSVIGGNPYGLADREVLGDDTIPPAFMERLRLGAIIRDHLEGVARATAARAGAFNVGVAEGFGPEPLGMSDMSRKQLESLGIMTDYSVNPYGRFGPISILTDAAIESTTRTLDYVMRSFNAGVHGAAGVFGEMVNELTGSEMEGKRASREATNMANMVLIEMGMGRFVRPSIGRDQIIRMQPIGGLPNAYDFANAAKAMGGIDPVATTERLRQLWWDRGIHPAEAAFDSQMDAFLRSELTAPRVVEQAEGAAQAGGADITRPENLPTPAEQPLPPPGGLVSAVRYIGNELVGLGRNLEMMLNPMATGSKRAMVAAKDYESTIYRIDWEWQRQDEDILRRFDHEQRLRMFTAMDEESVALQLGESREHQGLVTLEPHERALVEDVDARQQAAWTAARDLGMVEGDGLPMHATRYVLNIANDDGRAPLALDTLGRNLTVRTGQMLHRKYMTIEETEAAARQLVMERLQKAGATPEQIAAATAKVEVARDIRAVALSTAKLEKAIAGRTLINHIKEIGEAAGEQLVHEGEPPVSEGWFHLNHPALRTWRPKYQVGEDGRVTVLKDAAGNTVFEPVPLYITDEFKGPLMAILEEPVIKHPLAKGSLSPYQAVMAIKGRAMLAIMNSPLIHNFVVLGKVAPSAPGQWAGLKLYFTGNRIVNDAARSSQLVQRGLTPIGHRGVWQDITSVMEEPNLKPGRGWSAQVLGAVPDLFNADPKVGNAVRRGIDRMGNFYHNTLLWDRVRDVQFGLADHMSRNLQQGGLDAVAADRIGSYFSNAIVGSIPKSAMSNGARQIANMMLFSRSFTLGNLQVLKTAVTGLPKPLIAQLERDLGMTLGEAGAEAAVKKIARGAVLGRAARIALGIIAIDYIIMKVTNSLFQNAANVAFNDSSWDDEFHGYTARLYHEMSRVEMDPFTLLNPLNFKENFIGLPSRLSATSENEPGRENRIFIGYAPDGTALYARNPMGKYPEEIAGWLTAPFDTLRSKFSPMAGATFDILANDQGFGRKVYDKTAETTVDKAHNIIRIADHIFMKHMPEMQITGAEDLLMGQGDMKTNLMRAFAPVFGFTVSQGAPGGMAKGEILADQQAHHAKFDLAWPEIRKAIRDGRMDEANAAMTELRVTPQERRQMIRAARDPGRISGKALREFLMRASPEDQEKFYRLRH